MLRIKNIHHLLQNILINAYDIQLHPYLNSNQKLYCSNNQIVKM